ncbi:MAG: NAD(+) synthase [Erysipelotrichaceae bacterium]
MIDGFIKVGCATTKVRVADCQYNTENIITMMHEASNSGCKLLVFPELSITSYTCGDLFLQSKLLDQASLSLIKIMEDTKTLDMIACVGLPLCVGSSLYNCVAVIYHGEILGMIPKMHIPNYSEFYEGRYFVKGIKNGKIHFNGVDVLFGSSLLFCCNQLPSFVLGVEICEDVWVSIPPSSNHALAGATVIANASASDEIIGKAAYRRELIRSQSAKTIAAYLYADAGSGESSTDMVYAGHNIICENGSLLKESTLFETGIIYSDIDVERMIHERRRTSTFIQEDEGYQKVYFDMPLCDVKLERHFSLNPFVPSQKEELEARCEEILSIQAHGLATRLAHTKAKTAVIGLSGGLDSALALVVVAKAFKLLNLDSKNIICVTMPCFGTTNRTKNNAITLSNAYQTTLREINIQESVLQHFSDINHDQNAFDVTYENSQARERTQVLMDIANQTQGLVIGTGDLSELALGWATYNGDHMSMYGVNASIPKTLVRYLIGYEAQKYPLLYDVLSDVLNTPVSPELLPPTNGEISQITEELVGPYQLHDFFLYYFLRFGYSPVKIYRISTYCYEGLYDQETIKKWLVVFVRRFFSQQFKRSCLPDGPKVGSVTLSPRGDLRMPSDACSKIWLDEALSL